MPNGLSIGLAFPLLAPDGSAAAPSYSFASETTLGLYRSSTANVTCAGNFNVTSSLGVLAGGALRFSGTSDPNASDVFLYRLASASLRLGFNPSATPIAQTFTVGESSRGTTDMNVAGANGTVRSGTGTGNAAGASLFFQTPTPTASGVVAQSYATRLTLSEAGAVFDLVNQGLRINGQTSGAGASAGTLSNAPSAGDPSFWLPINIAGALRWIPCWA